MGEVTLLKGFTRDGKFHPITRYKKVRKALDQIRTVKKTKGIKMTSFQARPTSQFATTLKKDERTGRKGMHVTAEWNDFIKENYPKAVWTVPHRYWKISVSEDQRHGLPIELEEVSEGSKFRTTIHPDVIENRSSQETKDAWRNLRGVALAGWAMKEESRKFLKLYARDQAEEEKKGYLQYGRFSDEKEDELRRNFSNNM